MAILLVPPWLKYVAAIIELIFFRASRRNMLPKINAFKQYYVRKQELVYLAYDDIVDCGQGVRTQESLK